MIEVAVKWYDQNRRFEIVDVDTYRVLHKSGRFRRYENAYVKCAKLVTKNDWVIVSQGIFF